MLYNIKNIDNISLRGERKEIIMMRRNLIQKL